jgi:hypothetical protein
MMMDPNKKVPLTKKWWEIRMTVVLEDIKTRIIYAFD